MRDALGPRVSVSPEEPGGPGNTSFKQDSLSDGGIFNSRYGSDSHKWIKSARLALSSFIEAIASQGCNDEEHGP